jgi:5-methyltetrahydropteroyltriglutamate--homocysteine methyltransferase
MKRSVSRILTTHVGSLPRPNDLLELYRDDAADSKLLPRLQSAIADVVRRQTDCGVDIVNDGEFGKAMRRSVDFGAWWSYVYDRLAGFELREEAAKKGRAAWTFGSKERKEFAEFYAEEASAGQGGVVAQGVQSATSSARMYGLTCTAPLKYTGKAIVQHDIENLKSALGSLGVEEAFMTAVSPATLQILPNEYYKSQEHYTWALVNHALRGIPEERVRFHICWGSWHGPHSGDLPLKNVVDLLLKVKAQAYSVEAGNVRHEHEWKLWKDTKLPDGKVLIPGVVGHSTNLIEHPELVADRIIRFAHAVGRENLIAGTDCGLGGRVHHQIAWAKLRAPSEGGEAGKQSAVGIARPDASRSR